jgi:hypothetical protein
MSDERPAVKSLADLATADSPAWQSYPSTQTKITMAELIERVANGARDALLLPVADERLGHLQAVAKAAGEYSDAHEALRGTTHGTIAKNIKAHAAAREALLAAVKAMRGQS